MQAVMQAGSILGGSWVVISRVIRPLIWVTATLLRTLLITTHEPPSRSLQAVTGLSLRPLQVPQFGTP